MSLRDYSITSLSKNCAGRRKYRVFAILVLLFICTTGIAAADTSIDISTGVLLINESGYKQGSTFTPWNGEDHVLTVTGSSRTNNITVESGSCTLILSGVTITPSNAPALSVHASDDGAGAKVTLMVTGENTLQGGTGCAAIEVKAGWEDDGNWSEERSGSVEIQGSGTLNVTGGNGSSSVGGGAGIGGNGFGGEHVNPDGGDFGSILLSDTFAGTIHAKGGNPSSPPSSSGGGAGVGGGGVVGSGWEYSGNISIRNGTLTAHGGSGSFCSGAGIGTGSTDSNFGCGNSVCISISGGTITAYGGDRAAGIGGGEIVTGGIIDISGGKITASGGYDGISFAGAGIGGGDNAGWTSITIRGNAEVEAHAGGYGAGIGGQWSDSSYEQTITITDSAKVRAYGGDGHGGPAIGVGRIRQGNGNTNISITSTEPVIAVAGPRSHGIGSGYIPNQYGVYLTIDGNTQVWAFNRDTVRPAIDWNNITVASPAVVGVGYTHSGDGFPPQQTLLTITNSTDQSTWNWMYYPEGNPIRIEIIPSGSTRAAATHSEFYSGNWAYIGNLTNPGPEPGPEPVPPAPPAPPAEGDGNME
ncbi:MAG: hypothetical protein O0W99_09430, partial [Methanocorpusculum sp.]|nr:hypothetical protein [Methanocorpusculum vombati]MCZ9319864.1 hypothetical protein [Methanocorpusculum sp.]MDE2521043.1 hypothetical protein [Methanocorpusculum sp.]MDE2534836.1 hypothetical protein [Methanocorpusculum sp.]MDE2546994.1 hypothetical protein [Methanocorpusculum sp.]